jgi:hypothetical protein
MTSSRVLARVRVLSVAVGFCVLGSTAMAQLNVPGHGVGVANTDQIGKVQYPPEGQWSFEGDYTDSGRQGQHGVPVGDVTFVAEGVHGMAISLDGDGDGVYLGNGQAYQFTGDFTEMVWVNPMPLEGFADGGVMTIFSKVNDQEAQPQADEDTHGFYVNSASGAYDFEGGDFANPPGTVSSRTSHSGTANSVTNIAEDGGWHHVAMVYDEHMPVDILDPDTGEVIGTEPNTLLTLYIDGVEDATSDPRRWSQQANEGPLKIGFGNLHSGANSANWPGNQPGPGGGDGTGGSRDCPRIFSPPAEVVADPISIECRTPDYNGFIDELIIRPGALTADEVQLFADAEVVCDGAGDAAITSISATPLDGLAGAVSVSVGVEGDGALIALVSTREYASDDEFMTEDTMYTEVVLGPTAAANLSNKTIWLPAGTWTITAFAYNDLACLPTLEAQSKMSTAPFTLDLLPGHKGPRVAETAGGFTFWFETENYNFYDDDNTDRPLPVEQWPDGVPDERRGPFVFFYEDADALFGGGLRRDGGLSRNYSLFQVQWDVDIGLAGGEEGPHILWSRATNSYNTSDFFSVEGDPDDEPIPTEYPYYKETGYSSNNHRINEWNSGSPFPGFGAGATRIEGETSPLRAGRISGHNKDLQDGENRLVLSHRQAGPGRGKSRTIFWDGILITNDLEVLPNDAEIKALEELNLFRRGDCNGDGACDLSDGVAVLNFSFLGGDAPACLEACDFNANGALDITNAIFLFNAKFQGGPPIRAPRGDCGFANSLVGCGASNCTDADSPFPRVRGD